MVLAGLLSHIRLTTHISAVKEAKLRGEGIRNENVDVFEVLRLQWGSYLELLVVELESIQNGLLLKLNFPRCSTDRVAGGDGADDQFGVLDLQSFVLVEGDELDLRKCTFNILQVVNVKISELLLLDRKFVHGLRADLSHG